MKGLLKLFGVVFTVITVIWDIVEFLAFPALCTVIGLLNSFPWQYYAISIGGYVVLFAAAEVIAHFIFKALDKKYTPILERKLEKYASRSSKKN